MLEQTSRFTNKQFFWLGGLILVLAGLLYNVLDPQYRTRIFNDDAYYVLTARDLVNSSQPRTSLIERHPDFPLPGLPLLLAPLAKLVQPHWTDLEKLAIVATLLQTMWSQHRFMTFIHPT